MAVGDSGSPGTQPHLHPSQAGSQHSWPFLSPVAATVPQHRHILSYLAALHCFGGPRRAEKPASGCRGSRPGVPWRPASQLDLRWLSVPLEPLTNPPWTPNTIDATSGARRWRPRRQRGGEPQTLAARYALLGSLWLSGGGRRRQHRYRRRRRRQKGICCCSQRLNRCRRAAAARGSHHQVCQGLPLCIAGPVLVRIFSPALDTIHCLPSAAVRWHRPVLGRREEQRSSRGSS